MSLVSKLKGTGPSRFGYGSSAEDVTRGLDLSGRTILVTGSNSGIGFETLRVLALRDARVIAAARTEEKARAATAKVGTLSRDPDLARRLWEESERIALEVLPT